MDTPKDSLASTREGVSTLQSDSLALVTGATSGVGRAIADAFADAGATVLAVGRDPERLESLRTHRTGRIRVVAGDLTDIATLKAIASSVDSAGGSLKTLVHAAGIFSGGSLQASSLDDLDRQVRINLRGPYALTQTLLPSLIAGRGQVVFINSSSGLQASSGNGAYAATKHGLRAIADSLREEVNISGVRVLSVYLGQTATPMQRGIYHAAGKPYDPERLIQPDDVAQIILSIARLPNRVEVTEIRLRPTRKPI